MPLLLEFTQQIYRVTRFTRKFLSTTMAVNLTTALLLDRLALQADRPSAQLSHIALLEHDAHAHLNVDKGRLL